MLTMRKRKARVMVMVPLIFAEIGKTQTVKRIGGLPDVRKHLGDLGFTVGGEVSIVSKLGGNVIVRIKESRVAVDDSIARKIMV